MPHEILNEQQVASYLHMDVREVMKLASREQIPARRAGGKFLFRKSDVDHWVEQRMHGLDRDRLAKIERGVRAHHGDGQGGMLVSDMIPAGCVVVPLAARTRPAVLRGLVALAEEAGLVYQADEMLAEIDAREDLCTTAILPGVALPHPRHPLPHDIVESFIAVGLTPGGIPYGAEDGSLTRLFFLICCKDDRTHLHVLARLAQMLHDPAALDEYFAAEDADALREALRRQEFIVVSEHHA